MFIWTSNIPLIRLVIILNMNQRPLGDVSNSFQTRLLFPYQRKEGGGGGWRGGRLTIRIAWRYRRVLAQSIPFSAFDEKEGE